MIHLHRRKGYFHLFCSQPGRGHHAAVP